MIVRTSYHLNRPPVDVWPLLCNSRMEPSRSCWFGLGLPQPRECRLPGGEGAVGSTRQCVSDQGTVQQKILLWDQPKRLSFEMEQTDLAFRRCVSEIVETFDLAPAPHGGTLITRTTRIHVTGWFRPVKLATLFVGLKKIHRHVFQNWNRICDQAA